MLFKYSFIKYSFIKPFIFDASRWMLLRASPGPCHPRVQPGLPTAATGHAGAGSG